MTLEKLNKLISLCKAEISISINEHTSGYQTVKKYLENCQLIYGEDLEISEEIKKVMIDKNIMVNIVFYPDTPIGSYSVYHYDVEEALDECLRIMEDR